MKTSTRNTFMTIVTTVLTLTIGMGTALSSRDVGHRDLKKPDLSVYQEECGSCHLAYPAQLLPLPIWQGLMANLEDHFGDNAELDADQQKAIVDWLSREAPAGYTNSGPLTEQDMRISQRRWFLRKHDELGPRQVSNNPKVRSLSQCDACHREAADADFDEDNINIPGYGSWDD